MIKRIKGVFLPAVILNTFFLTSLFSQTNEQTTFANFSQDQISKLAGIISTNYEKEGGFKWVCLKFESRVPQDLRDGVIKNLSERYVVYLNPQDIAEQYISGYYGEGVSHYKSIPRYRNGKGLPSYHDGLEFNLDVEQQKNGMIKIYFNYHLGDEQDWGTSITYSWNGIDWVKVSQGPTYMS